MYLSICAALAAVLEYREAGAACVGTTGWRGV